MPLVLVRYSVSVFEGMNSEMSGKQQQEKKRKDVRAFGSRARRCQTSTLLTMSYHFKLIFY
jgi:hypothetical protein